MKTVFVGIVVLSAILVKKLYIFQTHEYFSDIEKGSAWDFLFYSIPFAILYTVKPL